MTDAELDAIEARATKARIQVPEGASRELIAEVIDDVPALVAEVRSLRAQAKADMDADDARYQRLYWAVFNALKDAGAPRFHGSNEEELVEGVRWLAAKVPR